MGGKAALGARWAGSPCPALLYVGALGVVVIPLVLDRRAGKWRGNRLIDAEVCQAMGIAYRGMGRE